MSVQNRADIVLVDTNVWLDSLLSWRPQSDVATKLIRVARDSGYELAYAVHQIKDIFYLSAVETKQKTREETGGLTEKQALAAWAVAWGCVENVCENATAIGADNGDVWLARKYRSLHDDFEDNLILAAAQRAHASFLVTSDEKLLQKSTVPAHTPHYAIELLELGLAAR